MQDFAAADNDSQYGCFIGTNTSGSTVTSINLVFADSIGQGGLNSQPATCLNSGSEDLTPAFGTSSCSLLTFGYQLTYSGGPGLAPGATLALAEYGANPESFGIGEGTVTLAPEPNSILLLSTGVLSVGGMLRRKRAKRFTHQ